MDVIDWLVLGGSCLLVTFLGMTKTKKKEGTSKELLIGSNMSVWAVTLSVCSGFISSISLLGFPAEVYYFGAIVLWLMAAYCIAFPMVAFLFLPVFYKLRLQSIYEYMELRFSRSCRFLGLAVFFTQTVLYTSVALFAPSLAVTSVTGIPLHFSIFFTACISATYISVGGARAGMHTSAIQMALIFIALLAIVVVNCYENSFIQAIKTAHAGHRLVIADFRLDPTVRHSFWSLFLGGIGNICCLFAANQLSVQRYMSMPTLKEAQKVVLLNIPCNAAILVCYILLGILIYSKYYLCDPNLPNMNELLPHFVLDSFSHLPGFAGLFIAAVYSAAISTLSASFTAISTVLLTEITLLHNALSSAPLLDSTIVLLSRILPFIVAVLIAILAWFCQFFKTLALQVAFTVFGAVGGPVLGTFTLGFFVPYARGHSGVVGLLCSLVACFTIAFGTVYYEVKPVRASLNGSCNNASLPFSSLDGFNWDKHGRVTANPGWLSSVSQVSYQYYSVIGVLVNLLCACLFQLLFGKNTVLDADLLSPLYKSRTSPNPSSKCVETSLL